MTESNQANLEMAREVVLQVFSEKFAKLRPASEFEAQIGKNLEDLIVFLEGCDTRTYCILIVSFLEDTLQQVFVERWAIRGRAKTETYFGPTGPLCTLSQRLQVALGIGWLDVKMVPEANTLRKIRNAFAHQHRVHTFSDTVISGLTQALEPVERMFDKVDAYRSAASQTEPEQLMRLRVFCVATRIAGQLLTRSKLIANQLPPNWRGEGFANMMEVEQRLIDATIGHCFRMVGVGSPT